MPQGFAVFLYRDSPEMFYEHTSFVLKGIAIVKPTTIWLPALTYGTEAPAMYAQIIKSLVFTVFIAVSIAVRNDTVIRSVAALQLPTGHFRVV